jgi:uncharacterized membrane protein
VSTAKLNIWITERGDPCRIDSKTPLSVHVLYCNGEVLEWCGRKYVNIPTRCGHVELEVPPGCYVVGAVENAAGIPPLGNHLTHIGIVRVECGDHACVTLFNPTFHHCGHWFLTAMRGHIAAGEAVPREAQAALRNAVQAVDALVRAIPQDPFTTRQARALGEKPPPLDTAPMKKSRGGGKKSGGKK